MWLFLPTHVGWVQTRAGRLPDGLRAAAAFPEDAPMEDQFGRRPYQSYSEATNPHLHQGSCCSECFGSSMLRSFFLCFGPFFSLQYAPFFFFNMLCRFFRCTPIVYCYVCCFRLYVCVSVFMSCLVCFVCVRRNLSRTSTSRRHTPSRTSSYMFTCFAPIVFFVFFFIVRIFVSSVYASLACVVSAEI